MNSDEHAVASVLRQYESALNVSGIDGVGALHSADGVFIRQNTPSGVGTDAVREAYRNAFRTICLNVVFEFVEVCQLGPERAFVGTNSSGTVEVPATGKKLRGASERLCPFQKVGGEWRIARYYVSTTDPLPA